MSENYYAKIEDGFVTNIIYTTQEFIDTLIGQEWIITDYHSRGGQSYAPEDYTGNTPFRKNFALIGFKYYREDDAFGPPQPFPNWVLNKETFLWDPPIPYPQDGKAYAWNNETLNWDVINIALLEPQIEPQDLLVNDEILASRRALCADCEHSALKEDITMNYCDICNCEILSRTLYKLKQCPIDKWGKIDLE